MAECTLELWIIRKILIIWWRCFKNNLILVMSKYLLP